MILFELSNTADLKELKRLLPEMVRFEPSSEDLELLKDGGVAIIDQWICAHARYRMRSFNFYSSSVNFLLSVIEITHTLKHNLIMFKCLAVPSVI